MSESQDLHRFVLGEYRTDGWKSQWRCDLEKKLAQPLPVYDRPLKEKPVPRPKKRRTYVPKVPVDPKYCSIGCGRVLGFHNKIGICNWCPRPPHPKVKLCLCGAGLNAQNATGECRDCYRETYADKRFGMKGACIECGQELSRRKTQSNRCRKHQNRFYKLQRKARMAA